jgi:Bacterial Ig domain
VLNVAGVSLVGETHEPQGTIFQPGDSNLHLFASDDGGHTFTDVFQRPYRTTTGYERLAVQFSYPNGDFPIQISGYGTIVAHIAGVAAAPPPTVSVTHPATGATFHPPAQITITADAKDRNGGVTKVDFYANSTLLGSDGTSPYSFSWSGVPPGSYSLTARATNSLGALTTSSPVNITVRSAPTAPHPPSFPACTGRTAHVRPLKIIVACGDGNFFITNLRWSRWNNTEAVGTGLGHQNLCSPDCARGRFHTYPVAVRLSKPAACAGVRLFTRLSYRYLKAKPSRISRTGTYLRNRCQ